MASKAPKVVAVVDEDAGTVSVGVEHDGQFLPVASKNLDYSKAVGASPDSSDDSTDDEKSEG